jgi:peptidyl-tRNA hydrolase, PTH2 family
MILLGPSGRSRNIKILEAPMHPILAELVEHGSMLASRASAYIRGIYFVAVPLLLLVLLFVVRRLKRTKTDLELRDGDYALSIIINTDYKMSKGKVVSQICHAMSGVMTYLFHNDPKLLQVWKEHSEPKIVLRASGAELKDIVQLARKSSVHYHRVHDAGRTQVPPGSNTVVAIGPAPKEKLALITGTLKLY